MGLYYNICSLFACLKGGFRNTTCRRFSCLGKHRGLERESFLHTGNFMTLRISTKQRCLREKGILAYGTSDRTEWRGNRRVGDFAQDGFSAGQEARAARAIFALLVGLNLGPGDRFPSSKREPGLLILTAMQCQNSKLLNSHLSQAEV